MKIPNHLLVDVVNVRPYNGQGGMGPIYGGEFPLDSATLLNTDIQLGSFTVKCRFEERVTANKQSSGTEVSYSAIAYFNGVDLRTQSLVTKDGRTYQVIDVKKFRNQNGSIHHLEVYLK